MAPPAFYANAGTERPDCYGCTVMALITTGVTGTFPCAPCAVVCTPAMASTTSIPSVTLAEDGVAVLFRRRAAVVEAAAPVVRVIDEELRRRAVHGGGARHRDRAAPVAEAVGRLVGDRLAGDLRHQVGPHAAALDHEVLDDPVEDGVLVEAGVGVLQEVADRDRRLVGEQLHCHVAHRGRHDHHRVARNHAWPCPDRCGRRRCSRSCRACARRRPRRRWPSPPASGWSRGERRPARTPRRRRVRWRRRCRAGPPSCRRRPRPPSGR